jgi:hypothetical protein
MSSIHSGCGKAINHPQVITNLMGALNIWVWVKIRYLNNWIVNTKLDIHICGTYKPSPVNGRSTVIAPTITTLIAFGVKSLGNPK